MSLRPVASLAVSLLVLSGQLMSVPAEARQAANPPAKQGAPAPKVKKPPSAKLAEPWPDAEGMAKRKKDAEGRALFQSLDPLEVTLAANFKSVNGDRDTNSTKTFPATLTVADKTGAPKALSVTLGTRGNLRLNMRTCAFVPLKVTFVGKDAAGTPFEGQSKLKMVTHCQDSSRYDQFVLKEYLAYRLHGVLTPLAFRARLVKATYTDASNGKVLSTHPAVFIEDEDDVAKRNDGRALSLPRMMFDAFDLKSLLDMTLFQYMIGNTDFSIFAVHNIAMVTTPAKVFYPITWDFDVSGLVSPPYGAPAPSLNIGSIRERLYRGPCRTMAEYEPSLAGFRSKQADFLAMVDTIPGLADGDKKDVNKFLGEFFTFLGKPDSVKKELVDRCRKQPTM